MSIKRWSVWLANLDPVVGSEQGRTRPVLIISQTALNDVLPVINVLPVTSLKAGRRIYPDEALLPMGMAGLPLASVVLCYQIRTLDKRRLGRPFGALDDETARREILNALTFQLDMR